MKFVKNYNVILVAICVALAIIPFFWLKPGEMDLGGDPGRLYFYDPITYLKNNSLYYLIEEGKGVVEPHFLELPFVLLIAGLKAIIPSSYLVISLFNVLKLVGGFLAVYLILKELIEEKKDFRVFAKLSAMLGGILYIFAPNIFYQWDKPLIVHNQVFLNPFILYLFLRYTLTNKIKYIWGVLLLTFLFAPNFSWIAAPTFFSFYPLAVIFLGLYVVFIRRKKIPLKGIFLGFLVFLGLHAFHLIPELANLLDPKSGLNVRTFDPNLMKKQLDVFYGLLSLNKLSASLFLSSIADSKPLISLAPFIAIAGLLLNKKKDKVLPLAGLFFLIILYLLTAKITNIGIEFYALLFAYVPGFSMFRMFIIQWLFVFAFFYALVAALAYFNVAQKLSKKFALGLFFVAVSLILIIDLPFIKGDFFIQSFTGGGKARSPIIFDNSYKETLSFIASLPADGKLLVLPFTDANFQVIRGANNGIYVGVSTISQLSGKGNFSGYFDIIPFSNVFWRLASEKDYDSIVRLLSMLNIHYIFYNKDPKIYDTQFFPSYPYNATREYFPKDQKAYAEFVKKLTDKEIFSSDSYSVYAIGEGAKLPHIFVAKTVSAYKQTTDDWFGKTVSFFVKQKAIDIRSAYIEKEICEKIYSLELCKSNIEYKKIPKIEFERINPIKYKIYVSQVEGSYLLVFSEVFHPNWKLFLSSEKDLHESPIQTYFQGDVLEGKSHSIFFDKNTLETFRKNSIVEANHVLINGYANGWKIDPSDVGSEDSYTLILELQDQKSFYVGLIISFISIIGFLLWGVYIWKKQKK